MGQEGEIDKSAIRIGNCNISLSTIDRTTILQTSKNVGKLNNAANQHNLMDIYRPI